MTRSLVDSRILLDLIADLKLIAHAMISGATVVTREQPAPDSKKKIKIPDVCNAFQVAWTDPFSAYRNLGLRLIS